MNKLFLSTAKIGATLILIGTLQSCSVFKKKTKLPGIPSENTSVMSPKKSDAKSYLKTAITYTTFEGRSDVSYADENTSQNVELIMKSIKDQKTYLEVRGSMFGLTAVVATALATPDTVKAISKLEGVYYQYSIAEAAQLINAPVDFSQLQQLLVGNPLFIDGKITSFTTEGTIAKIIMTKEGFVQTLFYNTENHQLQQLFLNNDAQQFECSIFFNNYRTLDNGFIFSFERIINFKYQGKASSVEMKFSNAVFQKPVDIKFNIPKTYRQVR